MMRNFLPLLVTIILFASCDDVVETTSIVQGEVNETLFRSKAEVAFNNEGELIIQGSNVDVVTLRTSAAEVGLYEISPNSGNSASFVLGNDTFITSGPDTGGMIEIEEITSSYVTGNFYFEARRNGVGERLNFAKGNFWRVPFDGVELPGDDVILPADEFSATINNTNLDYQVLQPLIVGNEIDIVATFSNGDAINLVLPNPSQVGDYTFEDNQEFQAFYLPANGSEQAIQGNISITAFETQEILVSGEFSFTTAEGTTVTNGNFVIFL